jgi:toxin-antitoxin system PIN domain toxin
MDISVLLSLLEGTHEFHGPVREWFQAHRREGWATCALTQAGFVRLAAQTLTGSRTIPHAFAALERLCSAPEHHFWALDYPIHQIARETRERLRGPKQLTDAVLLDLAIRRGGRLVTLDRRIRSLLPPDSPHRASLEVIEL